MEIIDRITNLKANETFTWGDTFHEIRFTVFQPFVRNKNELTLKVEYRGVAVFHKHIENGLTIEQLQAILIKLEREVTMDIQVTLHDFDRKNCGGKLDF